MNSHEIVEHATKAVEELAGALEAGHSRLTQYLAAKRIQQEWGGLN